MSEDNQLLEGSTLERMERSFWTTKQIMFKKLGRKVDDCIIASDSDLDQVLDSLNTACALLVDLLKLLELYHKNLLNLWKTESALGAFLKESGTSDATEAGLVFRDVGEFLKAIPKIQNKFGKILFKLYEDIETFIRVAMDDILKSVEIVENARTTYRGTLMWMKYISKELDPDHPKRMKKFRKVQSQVKYTKTKFDRLKCKVIEKANLLLISKSNLLTQNAGIYQEHLLESSEMISHKAKALYISLEHEYPNYIIFKQQNLSTLELNGTTNNNQTQSLNKMYKNVINEDKNTIKGENINCEILNGENGYSKTINNENNNCKTTFKIINKEQTNCNKEKGDSNDIVLNIEEEIDSQHNEFNWLINFNEVIEENFPVQLSPPNYSSELFTTVDNSIASYNMMETGLEEKKISQSEFLNENNAPSFLPSQLLSSNYNFGMGDMKRTINCKSNMEFRTHGRFSNSKEWLEFLENCDSIMQLNNDSEGKC